MDHSERRGGASLKPFKLRLSRPFADLEGFSESQSARLLRAASGTLLRRTARIVVAVCIALLPAAFFALFTLADSVLNGRGRSQIALSWPVVATTASLVTAPLLALFARDLFLRSRIRSLLDRREICLDCGYSLAGMRVPPSNTLLCPECTLPCELHSRISEVALDASGQPIFTPALWPRPRWTPVQRRRIRRAVFGTLLAAPAAILIFLAFNEIKVQLQAERAAAQRPPDDALMKLALAHQGMRPPGPDGWELLADVIAERKSIDAKLQASLGREPPRFASLNPMSRGGEPGSREPERGRARAFMKEYTTRGLVAKMDAISAEHRNIPRIYREEVGPVPLEAISLSHINTGRMWLAAQKDDAEEYKRAVMSSLRIADVLYLQPDSLCHYTACGIESGVWANVGSLLSSKPSQHWMAPVERLLEQPRRDFRSFLLEAERLRAATFLADLFSDPSEVRFGRFSKSFRTPGRLLPMQPQLRLGTYEENIAAANSRFDDLVRHTEPWQRTIGQRDPGYTELQLEPYWTDLTGGIVVRHDERELHFRAAQVMLALERYRLSMGEYPLTLEALVPAYLDRMPADPFSGNPLCYRLLHEDDPALRGQSYLLYSVGGDMWDNGGQDLRHRSALARREILECPPRPSARALDYILTPPDR